MWQEAEHLLPPLWNYLLTDIIGVSVNPFLSNVYPLGGVLLTGPHGYCDLHLRLCVLKPQPSKDSPHVDLSRLDPGHLTVCQLPVRGPWLHEEVPVLFLCQHQGSQSRVHQTGCRCGRDNFDGEVIHHVPQVLLSSQTSQGKR